MRTRSAAAVVGSAVALGLLAGGIVLPRYFGLDSAGPAVVMGTPAATSTASRHAPKSTPTASPTPPSATLPPQDGPLGTSQFLRNRDLFGAGFYASYRRTTGTGEDGSILASCGGEDESVTKHAPTAELLHARWQAPNDSSSDRGGDLMGYEVIGQTRTPALAERAADAAVKVLSGCIHQPATHWYYSKPTTTTTNGTRLTVFIIYDGDGKQHGSSAVFLDRRRFGVLELATYGGTDQQLTAISAIAARRLG